MVSTLVDRLSNAVFPGYGTKTPVLVASTGNLTLSGLQTIDGVTVSAGDRVLPKNQTLSYQNGVYVASGSSWSRDADFTKNSDVTLGCLVPISLGTVNGGMVARVTSTGSGNNGRHVFAGSSTSDAITFQLASLTQSTAVAQVPAGGTGSTTFAIHGLLVGNSSNAINALAAATSGTILQGQGTGADPAFTATPTLGSSGVTKGSMSFASTAGTLTLQPSTATITYSVTFPSSAGSSGQFLQTVDGLGTLGFVTQSTSAGSGTVTAGSSGQLPVYPAGGGATVVGSTVLSLNGAALSIGSSIVAGSIIFDSTQAGQTTLRGSSAVTSYSLAFPSSIGSSGQNLQLINAAAGLLGFVAGGSTGLGNAVLQIFNSSTQTVYTASSGLVAALVICTGGGSSGADGSAAQGGAGGGGAGGTAIKLFSAATLGSSQAVTINGPGASTIFGSTTLLTGNAGSAGTGGGGTVGGAAGAGGAATSGLFNPSGGDGDPGGGGGPTDSIIGSGGTGGASIWGGGGRGGAGSAGAGSAGSAPGSGGGGGAGNSGTGNRGKGGAVLILELTN